MEIISKSGQCDPLWKYMYTVTWNPGTFGHLLVSIIAIEEQDQDVNNFLSVEHTNSHFDYKKINVDINMVHPYNKQSLDSQHKIIKPYFKNENLKYFQWYRNEVAYLNSNRNFIEELRQRWNTVEPLCDISYNIDMTEFFTNQQNFCANMAQFVGKLALKDDTLKFIETKRKLNWDLYKNYLDNVVNTVKCLRVKTHKNISHLNNIEIGMVLCEYLHMDSTGMNNFCNNYDSNKPISTTEILSYA
jgi:hypothetical protein